jgi:DNA-directed RNA polymerase specialized sigma24 family protein
MNVPPGYTEKQVLESIERAVRILAPGFVFGHFDVDDIKQHGRMAAVVAIDSGRYDPARPLDNFVYTAVRNALVNLKRDKHHRTDAPCRRCHDGDFCCRPGPCKTYAEWSARNQAKANIARPLGLDHVADEKERSTRLPAEAADEVEVAELLQKVDAELPVELREVYLQMRAGVTVSRARRAEVEAAVRQILGGDVCPSSDD